ncbi:MAG TPA: hypothetical protein ACQGQH_01685 [Xylella sp.]
MLGGRGEGSNGSSRTFGGQMHALMPRHVSRQKKPLAKPQPKTPLSMTTSRFEVMGMVSIPVITILAQGEPANGRC